MQPPEPSRPFADVRRRARTVRLWEQWREHGDPRARARLIESLMGLATAASRKRMRGGLPPHADADDMRSAAYVALIRAVERFDPARGIPLEAYVWRRCEGAVLDWVRQEAPGTRRVSPEERPAPEALDAHADTLAASDRREDPVASLELHDVTRAVHAALGRLPERERTAIVACALEGSTLAAVGTELGVSTSRVAQLRARGITRLHDELAPHRELVAA
jgi:RNA polymerase sigma factor (sigma-70 family)